jgi:hypothetical protein
MWKILWYFGTNRFDLCCFGGNRIKEFGNFTGAIQKSISARKKKGSRNIRTQANSHPGKFAPGKFAPGKFAPGKFAPQKIRTPENSHPRKFAPRQIRTQANSHPENSHPENSHPENSHPMQI